MNKTPDAHVAESFGLTKLWHTRVKELFVQPSSTEKVLNNDYESERIASRSWFTFVQWMCGAILVLVS